MSRHMYVAPEDWPGLDPELEATIEAGSKEALKEKAVDLLNQFDPDTWYIYTLTGCTVNTYEAHCAGAQWRTGHVFEATLKAIHVGEVSA